MKIINPYSSYNQIVPNTKKRILCWADSPLVSTGFATVSKNILKALYNTGLYDIDMIAINHPIGFYDMVEYPYQIIPARAANQQDVYGGQLLIDTLKARSYDFLFVINDLYVTHSLAKYLKELQHMQLQERESTFNIVYYYPVDSPFLHQASGLVQLADYAVAYTKFGVNETKKHLLNKPDTYIYHGVDEKIFFPLSDRDKQKIRSHYWKQYNPDTFIIVNVNRNSMRKDIARSILAFSHFKKEVPNSLMYVHTKVEDGTAGYMLHLGVVCQELNLSFGKDIIFPQNYSAGQGFPIDILNQLYNGGNCYLTTHLGEGFGLCLDSSTILDTLRGGIPIKDILVGDSVIGQDGKFHKVLDKTNRIVDEIYEIKSMYNPQILVTKEHPFYVLSKNGTLNWKNVKDIEIGDYLATPKYKENETLPNTIDILDYLEGVEYDDTFVWYKMGHSPKKVGLSISDIQNKFGVSKRVAEDARRCFLNTSLPSRGLPNSLAYSISEQIKKENEKVNIQKLKIKRHIPITNEFLYLIGWYLAEGSNGNKAKIELDFHIDELKIAESLGTYLENTFFVKSIIEQNGINKCRVRVSGKALATIFGIFCGINAKNKKVPDFLIKSPKYLGQLVLGLFLGDGHLNNRNCSLTTISPSLAFQIRNICSANNILLSIKKYPPREKGKHNTYVCSIASPHLERWDNFTKYKWPYRDIDRKAAVHFIEDNNYFYCKVKETVHKISNNKQVYDICVQDTHSFVANGILAHNTISEAMSAGLPVIVPDNSCMRELVGENQERGYMYPCKEKVYIDNSGFRDIGHMEDILKSLFACYNDWRENSDEFRNKINNARLFCKENSWENICASWVKIFKSLRPKIKQSRVEEL